MTQDWEKILKYYRISNIKALMENPKVSAQKLELLDVLSDVK